MVVVPGLQFLFANAYSWMQFYFQNGCPPPSELKERCLFRINQFFYGHINGLQMNGEIYSMFMY